MKDEKGSYYVGQVAREVEPVIIHRESGTQLSLFEAVVLILNKLDKK
jgi:hypothetical protein